MREDPFWPVRRYVLRPLSPEHRRLRRILREEAVRKDVQLTRDARAMLMIPVLEVVEQGRAIDWRDVESSLSDLFEALGEHREDEVGGASSAVSVIRAFWKRFCNIPPFCARTEDG